MELATAYVQIVPTTKGIKNNITNELNDQMAEAGHSSGQSWGNALGGVVKATLGVVTGAVATAGGAVVGLTKQAVDSYADYEQLVGGLETMFEDLAWDVEQYANQAFKTAGLSANDYMETVMGFSASLTSSLEKSEGNIARSADLANQIVIDMSDNANKMGSSMESIQNAYQGFAKQNYTMLDNLKLGYGGTKAEMERLLEDAKELTGIEYNIDSFADIAEAIHAVQEEMGITGTTAKEASETISGSISSMKGAWENLVASLAKDEADFEGAIQDLIDSIVGKDGKGGVVGNLLPRIEKTLNGTVGLITALAPVIAEKLPPMLTSVLPTLLKAVKSLVKAVADNLPSLIKAITAVMPDLMATVVDALLVLLPVLVDCALELVVALADGISEALPVLVPPVMEMLLKVTDTIINNLPLIIDCAIQIVDALIKGLVQASPMLLDQGTKLMVDFIASLDVQFMHLIEGGMTIIDNMIKGIEAKLPELWDVAKSLPGKIKGKMFETAGEMDTIGTRLATGILQGFKTYFDSVLGDGNWVSNIVTNLINKILSAFNSRMASIDWGASVPSVTPTVNLFGGMTAQTSAVNASTAPASTAQTITVALKQDKKATTKAVVSSSYSSSKASGIPSGILSQYGK